MSGAPRSSLGLASRDMNNGVPISAPNSSGPSVGVSSLVTDANSSLSGGPQLQQSTSINAESCMRLPASPMSFSSNNISASSVIDGSSIVQQSPPEEHVQKRRSSSVTSHPVIPDQGSALHAPKKHRIDVRQDDIMNQHLIQQLLQGQGSHLQGQQSPQLQALIRQQKLAQLQQQQQHPNQVLQAFPQVQAAQIMHQRQQQMRPQLIHHAVGTVKIPVENGLCSRRLMQFLYHKRHRPEDNSISYWRKLIDEYFAPQARERWCVSSYDKRVNNASSQQTDLWRCDICNAKAGKGYEATCEILPRLCQIRFDHGVIDEYIFPDMPYEFRMSTGVMVLEYTKVVHKSVYEHSHVVHEGQLRIVFTPELKIISWEFCARRHEEYVTRRFLNPAVNHLLQVAQKYQITANESGPAGVSNNDAQSICNSFVTASRQLAKSIDTHLLNEHGLSKRYVRCLQVSEVVNSMKDLIDFSNNHKIGPIEGLKNYPKQSAPKLHPQNMQEVKQLMTIAGQPTDQSILSKVIGSQPEMRSYNMNSGLTGVGVIRNMPTNAAVLGSYQSMLRNSMGANEGATQQEASSAFKIPTQMQNAPQHEAQRVFRGPNQMSPLQFQNTASFNRPLALNSPQLNNLPASRVNEQYQEHVIQQLLQEANKTNSRITPHQSPRTPNVNGGQAPGTVISTSVISGEQSARMNNGPMKSSSILLNGPGNVVNSAGSSVPSRSNSFKSISSNAAAVPPTAAETLKAEPAQDLDFQDIDQILAESGLFMQEPGAGGAGFSWSM